MSIGAPSVSIILAILNEESHIDEVLSDLTRQDYVGSYEIVVADGGSDDGTRQVVAQWSKRDSRVRLVDNARKRQAFGLNAAANAANGDILIRADGHTSYSPNYVSSSVRALDGTNMAVGGPMTPVGRGRFGRAVAAAMSNPLSMGPAKFHHASKRQPVDTVFLGAFPKADFNEIGGFRSLPSGSSEDADFYFRWRQSGRSVYVDPAIISEYYPRESAGALWRQYFRYGLGKAEMFWINGRLPSWRPLAPLALVLGLLVAITLSVLASNYVVLTLLLGSWLTVLAWVGSRSDEPQWRVMAAAVIMHLSYGIGAGLGFARGPFALKYLK